MSFVAFAHLPLPPASEHVIATASGPRLIRFSVTDAMALRLNLAIGHVAMLLGTGDDAGLLLLRRARSDDTAILISDASTFAIRSTFLPDAPVPPARPVRLSHRWREDVLLIDLAALATPARQARATLPWTVTPHRANPTLAHIVDRHGLSIATSINRDVATFIVARVNQEA